MDILAAKSIAIPSAVLLSGYYTAHAHNIGPQLLTLSPGNSTTLFRAVYHKGGTFVAPLSLLATSAFAYLAYVCPEQRMKYATAAGFSVASLPWTALVMMRGIQRLVVLSNGGAEKAGAEVNVLLSNWVWQTWVRASFALVGGVVGLGAVLVVEDN